MKKITLVLAGSVLLFTLYSIPTYAQGCLQNATTFGAQNSGCPPVNMPEPSSFMLLGTGLAALCGFAILARKRLDNRKG
jgi:hypothetical protein